MNKPTIICLCGSTRFTAEMLVKQWELTKQGYIVLSWCALPEWYFLGNDKTHIGDQEGVKEIVDTVHLRKIDIADEVLVINIGGYIGESTTREIRYAEALGKPIEYLELTVSIGDHSKGHTAGYQAGFKRGYYEGKTKRIREVVEWLRTYGGELYLDEEFTDKRYCITSDVWQAKLKEWGIK